MVRTGSEMESIGSAVPTSRDIFLTAEWKNLVMLNYEVDRRVLQRFVPSGTELDLWNSKLFISLVGFRFLKTKVFGFSIPFHCNFEEVNLRFYVRRFTGDEVRRGVVFIREIVPRWAIATMARTFYNENYAAMPMRHQIQSQPGGELAVQYAWKSVTDWNRIGLTATGTSALPSPGSEEQFITEHYWGYAAQKNGGCVEYRVEHPAWKVWSAVSVVVEGDMTKLYGTELSAALKNSPASAFLAEGSAVTVSRGRRL
jgi:uncharacterized protein YqjF (DUF2071 family)